jgi:hypothetical protein
VLYKSVIDIDVFEIVSTSSAIDCKASPPEVVRGDSDWARRASMIAGEEENHEYNALTPCLSPKTPMEI